MGELTAVDSQLLGAVALQIDGNGSELVPSGWGKIVHRLCKPNLLVCRERGWVRWDFRETVGGSPLSSVYLGIGIKEICDISLMCLDIMSLLGGEY